MNRLHSLLTTSLFIFSSTAVGGCNPNEKKAKSQSKSASYVSLIKGAWETISADRKITQLKMWHDGFFSLIMQDSSGKWSMAGAGSYFVEKILKRKHFTTAVILNM